MMSDTNIVSQINYSRKEKEIRKSPEYSELLAQLQPGGKVIKYKSDELDICLTSGEKKIRQIKVPICIEDCNHEIFDLYDIFLNKGEITCKKCHKKGTKKNIKKEEYYTFLIKNMSEKSFSCSIVGQLCFHSFSQEIQPIARELLKKNQYLQLFTAVVQNSRSKADALKENLLNLIEQKSRELNQNNPIHTNRILEFPFQCLINYQKIIIPVQLSECKHLDCYEYTNILKLIDDEKKLPEQFQRPFVRCYYQGCETLIPLDLNQLKQKLIFPYDFGRAISKNYPFSLNLIWDFQKSGFEYQKIKIQEFLKNIDLRSCFSKENGLDYVILSQLKKIINKELSSQLQNKLHFSKYKVNLEYIQFPSRCNYCELQNVKDIEDFLLSYYIQDKHEKKNYFICPACNYKHDNFKTLEQIIYFDGYLYNALQKANNRQQFEYNKSEDKFTKFFQSHQIIDFKQIKTLYQQTRIYPYAKQFCTLSNKKLKLPLILIYCEAKRAVELKGLKKFWRKIILVLVNFLNAIANFARPNHNYQLQTFTGILSFILYHLLAQKQVHLNISGINQLIITSKILKLTKFQIFKEYCKGIMIINNAKIKNSNNKDNNNNNNNYNNYNNYNNNNINNNNNNNNYNNNRNNQWINNQKYFNQDSNYNNSNINRKQ
ncbi:unnamed protein product (macronuclear) [Paramecium tetraurelia]|uniref:Uncharacterized protein n=1 Tax=Paramecium tetraurelia TaxID=5888 RepID=A0BMF4_PARTE|nr:uncharacterized protein GSPATT00030357001 [Paramecium tetraurelia]CAK59721.1 unnamed protein product [Paramecium tetraurelia]|eukprot:XP_001427119.1 hypothetical protein (macronuclear) [Paramecium tetraurelia strain d4-2]